MSDNMHNPSPAPQPGGLSKEARTFGMLSHLLALVGYVLIPLGNVIGPLVIWLIKKDEFPFVDDQGKESLNFQLSMLIYFAVSIVLKIVLIGFVLFGAVWVFGVIMTIIAAIQANEGVAYRYPLTIRFLK